MILMSFRLKMVSKNKYFSSSRSKIIKCCGMHPSKKCLRKFKELKRDRQGKVGKIMSITRNQHDDQRTQKAQNSGSRPAKGWGIALQLQAVAPSKCPYACPSIYFIYMYVYIYINI